MKEMHTVDKNTFFQILTAAYIADHPDIEVEDIEEAGRYGASTVFEEFPHEIILREVDLTVPILDRQTGGHFGAKFGEEDLRDIFGENLDYVEIRSDNAGTVFHLHYKDSPPSKRRGYTWTAIILSGLLALVALVVLL